MKAKEYITKFKSDPQYKDDPAGLITDILLNLKVEFFLLIKTRNCHSDAAVSGCFREIRQKWYAIYPSFQHGEKCQFDLMFKTIHPELYSLLAEQIEMEKF